MPVDAATCHSLRKDMTNPDPITLCVSATEDMFEDLIALRGGRHTITLNNAWDTLSQLIAMAHERYPSFRTVTVTDQDDEGSAGPGDSYE